MRDLAQEMLRILSETHSMSVSMLAVKLRENPTRLVRSLAELQRLGFLTIEGDLARLKQTATEAEAQPGIAAEQAFPQMLTSDLKLGDSHVRLSRSGFRKFRGGG